MTAKQSASIGDALIFMTKAAVLLIALGAGAWISLVVIDDRRVRTEAALRAAHVKVLDLEGQLSTCVTPLPKPPEGVVLNGPWTKYQKQQGLPKEE